MANFWYIKLKYKRRSFVVPKCSVWKMSQLGPSLKNNSSQANVSVVNVYVYTHVSVWIRVYMRVYVCVHICMHACILCADMCVSVYFYVNMFGLVYVCICVHVYICECVHVCVWDTCVYMHRTKQGRNRTPQLRMVLSRRGEDWRNEKFHIDFHFSLFKYLDHVWLLLSFLCFSRFRAQIKQRNPHILS